MPPSLGDIDGDGTLDVVAAVNEEYVEPPNAVFENPIIQLFQAVGVLDSGNTRVYALLRRRRDARRRTASSTAGTRTPSCPAGR